MTPDEAAHRKKDPAPAPQERTDLYEEFKRPGQPDDKGKTKGYNAAGYKFPPETPGTAPAMTKENIAKGVTFDRKSAGEAPPPELKEGNAMFETYERPDLSKNPRTGGGLRALPPPPPQPKTAREILHGYEPPEPQVFTPKRDRNSFTSSGLQGDDSVEHDAAHLDAEADLAATRGATMSHSRRHGPTKVLTNEDPFLEMPKLPGEPAPPPTSLPTPRLSPAPIASSAPKPVTYIAPPTPAPLPVPTATPAPTTFVAAPPAPPLPAAKPARATHVSDAPPVPPGDGPKIGLIQSDFNFDLTTRMAEAAKETAKHLGCTVTHHLHAPGVYDIPLMAKALAKRPDVEAIVVVGVVIQGETSHDEVIAQECARKLADLAYETEKPVGFAVSGPRMTKEAAEARVPMARHGVESVVKQWRSLKALHAARHHD